MTVDTLHALEKMRAIVKACQEDPLEWISWLPVQASFLADDSPIKLLRAGNQVGKTMAGLAEVHFQALGRHPLRQVATRPPGARWEAWVVCASWPQSLAIQEKLWQVARRHLIDDCRFDPVNGFHANKPAAIYKNGAIVRFKTSNQDSLDLAGATINLVLFDEPPRPTVFAEVLQRVKRLQGQVCLTLTPIGAPVDWLRAMVEEGTISEHHTRLTPEALVPIGEHEPLKLPDGRPMDAAWIAEAERVCLPSERDVRIHGGWETRTITRVFDAFDTGLHVRPITGLPEGEWELVLGLDHGTKEYKQSAILAAVQRPVKEADPYRVIVLDEDVGAHARSQKADALALLEMLDRNGFSWKDLDEVWGDRIHIGGTGDKKANRDLQANLARLLHVDERSLKPGILTVKRGVGRNKGSVMAGCRWVYQLMVEPGSFVISPRCAHLIDAFEKWQGADDVHKDKLDALRYALQSHIFRRQATLSRASAARTLRFY